MGISIARSCDANGLITAGLKFPQQSAIILGRTTLSLWSISHCCKDTKLHKTERIAFPAAPVSPIVAQTGKSSQIASPSLYQSRREQDTFFCSLHIVEWRKSISWIHTAQTCCWLLVSQHETTVTWQINIQTILNQWTHRPRGTYLTTYPLHQ